MKIDPAGDGPAGGIRIERDAAGNHVLVNNMGTIVTKRQIWLVSAALKFPNNVEALGGELDHLDEMNPPTSTSEKGK